MNAKIETVSARTRLKTRREPYWHRLIKGGYVGYRRMSAESPGTWVARYRDPSRGQLFDSMGSLEEYPAHERFDRAVANALAWISGVSRTVPNSARLTVGDACRQYGHHQRAERGAKAAADTEARFRRWIYDTPLASIELAKLTRDDCREFRRRLLSTPVQRGRSVFHERSRDTVNRDMSALRAALNFAYAEGRVANDSAWREPLKPFPNASRRRELYLDREQREILIRCAEPALADFLAGLAALPLRPGALAALNVSSFNPTLRVLKIGKDKHGQDRKLRLGDRVAQMIHAACGERNSDLPLFVRSDGRRWDKDAWKHPIKAAALKGGLPDTTTAYALRHSVITDLVHQGLDLLTVAQISGTSVAMIEAHYGHLRSEVAAAALDRVAVLQ